MKLTYIIVPVLLIGIAPLAGYAATGQLTPSDMISQMQSMLDQYKTQVQSLEAENKMLRNVMAQNGVAIPLEDYVSAMGTGSFVTLLPTSTGTTTPTTTTPPVVNLTTFQSRFIEQIHADWEGIK